MNAAVQFDVVDPVVVCGPPRSGVRLLASLLHSNAGFVTAPELPLVITMARQWKDIVTTLGENHERHYGVPRDHSRAAFRDAILQLIAQRASAARSRFVMQSFGATLAMDILAEIFPNSRFVVMTRDPRDVVRSLLASQWLHPRDGKPLSYTQDAAAAAKFWLDFMRLGIEQSSALGKGGRLLFMRYEDLCRNPVGVLAELAAFLGVPTLRPALEPSSCLQAAGQAMTSTPLRAGAIDQRSVGAWRTTLSASQVSQVDAITRGLRVRLGYA
jgi:LPS sulfotransferase NodH